jgi:nicotinamidase-related amidase
LNRAALLLDLQVDFLAPIGARMPVGEPDTSRVIALANQVLEGSLLPGCLPVLVVNEFPRSDWIGNFFRHGAAICGTPGSALDARIRRSPGVRIVPKRRPSAFTNPALDALLKANAVSELYLLGVFAEACVRATALDGRRRGYSVVVPLDGIGTNSRIKRDYAVWAMRRGGVEVIPSLLAPPE